MFMQYWVHVHLILMSIKIEETYAYVKTYSISVLSKIYILDIYSVYYMYNLNFMTLTRLIEGHRQKTN